MFVLFWTMKMRHISAPPSHNKTDHIQIHRMLNRINLNSADCWMTVFSWGRSEGELIGSDKHQMIQLNQMPSYQRTDVILGKVRHAENAAKGFLQLLSKMSPSLSPLLQLLCGREQDPNFHRNTLLNVWPINVKDWKQRGKHGGVGRRQNAGTDEGQVR